MIAADPTPKMVALVEQIFVKNPALPRAHMYIDDIRAALCGTSEGVDKRAYSKVKYLIEAYAHLRLHGTQQQAAWIAVFRCGRTRDIHHLLDNALEGSKYIEATFEYLAAMQHLKSIYRPEDIWNPRIALEWLDQFDEECSQHFAFPSTRKKIAAERRRVEKALNKQLREESERAQSDGDQPKK